MRLQRDQKAGDKSNVAEHIDQDFLARGDLKELMSEMVHTSNSTCIYQRFVFRSDAK